MIVKGILFKRLNTDGLMEFLKNNGKTQVVNSDVVFGKKHVIHSVNQTLKAFAQGRNISKNQPIELLLRLYGERQISKALEKCKAGKRSIFVSWGKDSDKIYDNFKSEFEFNEFELPEQTPRTKEAIEKSSTFWLC